MANKTDYNKPHTNLHELLPEVYQSNLNKALAENLFNRFLTKTELQNVNGVIGTENVDDRLSEPTVHRQTFQLQPLLHNKIATVDHLGSFKDMLRESERVGVNTLRVDEWADALQFNFVPPVDMDKITNFSNYFWLSPTDPVYITIKNRLLLMCNVRDQGWADNPGLEALSISYLAEPAGPAKDLIADDIEAIYTGFVLILEEKEYLVATNPITESWDNVLWDELIDGIAATSYTVGSVTIPGDLSSILNSFPEFPFTIINSTGAPDNNGAFNAILAVYTSGTDTTEVFLKVGQSFNPAVTDGIFGVGEWDINDGTPIDLSSPFGFKNSWNAWNIVNAWTHVADIPDGINVSTLAVAEFPIIEYDSFMELNNWSHVNHNWNYRADNASGFNNDTQVVTNQEIFAADDQLYDVLSFPTVNSFVINSTLNAIADLVVDAEFTMFFNTLVIVKYFTVVSVLLDTPSVGQMTVEVDASIPSGAVPATSQASGLRFTSRGDDWQGFQYHWQYLGQDDHTAVNSQELNENLIVDDPTYLDQSYIFPVSNYLQEWYTLQSPSLILPFPTFRPHTEEIRVYVNGIRQYGSYVEGYTLDGLTFTVDIPPGQDGNAIRFFNPPGFGNIRVDVGPAAASDTDRANVEVRTNTDDIAVLEDVSLIEYRLTEQELTEPHQYPLFDIYNLDGSTAFLANPVWKYLEGSEYGIHPVLGERVVNDGQVYSFEQLILVEDDGQMYAYKACVNPTDSELSLLTIWRKGLNDERYTPSYIDVDRDPIAIGDPDGDWEVVDQMFHNLEHENKRVLTTVDLLLHYRTIIAAQEAPPGFNAGVNNLWRVLIQPNLGVGGTIKEFNDGFDSFMSSVFVKTVTMVGILEFANRRYEQHLNIIRQYFEEKADVLIPDTTDEFILDLESSITADLLNRFVNNGGRDFVFGDSTTPIQNWVATLPYVGLAEAFQPELMIDPFIGLVELRHHDGHVSNPTVSNVKTQGIISRILKEPNTSFGPIVSRPLNAATAKGHIYHANDVRILYKNNVISVGSILPAGFPDGTYAVNTNDNMLYVVDVGVWIISPDQNAAWKLIDITILYAESLLEIEIELYNGLPTTDLNYDITQVLTDIDFDVNEQKQFTQFTKEYNIANPAASFYDATNAFTWNYSNVDVNDYCILNLPTQWAEQSPAAWYDIYTDVFGTRYPHLEPWKLQFYPEKPFWWDAEYAGTTRRWSFTMWGNILGGVVPNGYEYPNGVISGFSIPLLPSIGVKSLTEGIDSGGLQLYDCVPVNIFDTPSIQGSFQPDEMLPPYYASTFPADASLLSVGAMLQVPVPSVDAAAEYPFGTNGPIEDSWRQSAGYLYALAEIAYLTQPVRFVHFSMGNTLDTIGGLTVETNLNKVLSHRDTVFHGDIVDGVPVVFHGVNQWYVHFIRFNAYDINTSDFRSNWVDWRPNLAYQMAAMIDVESLNQSVDIQRLDISDSEVLIKHTLGLTDSYIDGLNLVVNQVGTSVLRNGVRVPVNKGADWSFRITSPNPSFMPIILHGVDTGGTPTVFSILDQSVTTETFDHFPIIDSVVLELTPGTIVSSLGVDYEGVQGLVNLLDGYVSYLRSQGYVFGSSTHSRIDPEWSRNTDWQFETERMIQEIYIGLATDELPIEFKGFWNYVFANPTTDIFTVTGGKLLALRDDDEVQIVTTNILPVPFDTDAVYYVVNVSGQTFQLALSIGGAPIDIATTGHGVHAIGMHKVGAATPASFFEVNPFKNTVVYNNEQGIIADIHKGPFTDIRIEQGIYDQYGRALDVENTRIYRGDKETVITVSEGIPNNVVLNDDFRNFLHIGGMHLFIDGYEHCILYNDQTIEGTLLFNEFLGAAITRLGIAVRKTPEVTFRPNVGGHYLSETDIRPNFEAGVESLQLMYDTHVAEETDTVVSAARRLIEFKSTDYFNTMDITLKSQLNFYRGVIQHKGSNNAVKAFINSKNYIDAIVDEIWAYKIGEFGDARTRGYPEIILQDTDSKFDKLSLHFTTANDPIQAGFIEITFDDIERWYNQPDQINRIFGAEPNLHFEAEVTASQTYTVGDIGQDCVQLPAICDAVVVIAFQTKQIEEDTAGGVSQDVSIGGLYIPNAGSIQVWVDDVFHTDFIEMDETKVTVNGLVGGEALRVAVGNAKLVEGTHYERLNAQVLFFNPALFTHSLAQTYEIFCLNPAKTKLNPVKLIDFESSINIQNISVWDPAKGHHYHNAEHIVTHQGNDPAFYTDSLTPDQLKVDLGEEEVNRDKAWLTPQVGDVWWDQLHLGYISYYDDIIIPDPQERFTSWGKLADWASVEIYEWIESPVVPSEYDQFVIDQQGEGVTISGTAKSTLFTRTRNGGSQLFDLPWAELKDIILHFDIACQVGGVVILPDEGLEGHIEEGEEVSIYKNGEFDSLGLVDFASPFFVVTIPPSFTDNDIMTVIHFRYEPTEEELEFDPDVEDDLSIDVQYKFDYKFSEMQIIRPSGDTESTYYFWVRNTATNHGGSSIANAEQDLDNNPDPFVIFQNLLSPDTVISVTGATVNLPARYTQSIFKGLVNKIVVNDRFKLRFTKDFTLRDDIDDARSNMNLKGKHTEWELIREQQGVNITRDLWEQMVHTMAGRDDEGQPIPSLDRILYDLEFDSTFRFGLREGQGMVFRQRAIDTLIIVLSDPELDLYPIDRDTFLANNLLDTPDNIEATLELIYTTFSPEIVNRIWFAVFYEGLASNVQYTDIFKTSWIQLDGIRLLDLDGGFS